MFAGLAALGQGTFERAPFQQHPDSTRPRIQMSVHSIVARQSEGRLDAVIAFMREQLGAAARLFGKGQATMVQRTPANSIAVFAT